MNRFLQNQFINYLTFHARVLSSMLRQGEQHIMQFMQMLKASMVPRRNIFASLVMVGVVASVMGLTPTHGASNTLAQDCPNPPTTPTFNYWPVTYDDVNTPFCHDFPAIDASRDTTPPQWSQSQADWDNGLTLNVGDNALAGIYIHNGAANNLDPEQTTAQDVRIKTETDTRVGSSHRITVTFTASNAPTYTKSFTVYTPADAQLEVVPNSGKMYDYQGRLITSQQNLNLGNSTFDGLGYLDACFEYSLFLTYKFKVIRSTPNTPTLSIDKGVRNITRDGDRENYSSSVTAERNDRVGYKVTVTNTSNTTARNVTMTDNGVSGITIDSRSVTVESSEGVSLSNDLWQGTIPGTIQLGDLRPGEKRIIKYTGTVTTDNCPTLTNTARAVAEGTSQVSDSASVTVVNCGGSGGNPNIKIKKWVKNNTQSTSYDDSSVNARENDRVNFKVTVSNTGNSTLSNVRMTDRIPDGLRFDDSVSGDGTASFNNNTLTLDFGSIRSDESKTVEFAVKVDASSGTICNVAKATGNDVRQVEDDACVKITRDNNPGTPRIVISKRAWNDTKNVDATSVNAARGDTITYTLVATNNGSADQTNYRFEDDLSQVLPLADMVSTNGGTISGNWINYAPITIRAGETVTKTFKVRVKQTLDKNLSYQLRNTYGNTIVINVPGERVYHAPKTGSAGTSAAAFAGLLTAGFVVLRKRNSIFKFIFA